MFGGTDSVAFELIPMFCQVSQILLLRDSEHMALWNELEQTIQLPREVSHQKLEPEAQVEKFAVEVLFAKAVTLSLSTAKTRAVCKKLLIKLIDDIKQGVAAVGGQRNSWEKVMRLMGELQLRWKDQKEGMEDANGKMYDGRIR